MINVFLKKFGLTKNEQEIYVFLLAHGAGIASIVGKRLGIKRVTAYAALESLEKKGLVLSFKKNNVTYFEAASGEKIMKICKDRVEQEKSLQDDAMKILPILKNLENNQQKPRLEVKGKIAYYQGLEAVTRLIDETINEDCSEQLCFGLNTYHTKDLKEGVSWKNYTKKRVLKGMSVRSIQPDYKAAKDYQKRDKRELRTTYLVPKNKFPALCELNIIGDMIAIFTAQGNDPAGTKIYNKDMAQVLTSLFNLAWECAEKYNKKLGK